MLGPWILLLIALVAGLALLVIGWALRRSRAHSFNVQDYQTRWLKIENSLKKGDERSYTLSVMEADKLLDRALKELGLPGNTMGERLKKADQRFSDRNHVWHAHKIRNQLAHEEDFRINYHTSSLALAAFKQALKDLGAI